MKLPKTTSAIILLLVAANHSIALVSSFQQPNPRTNQPASFHRGHRALDWNSKKSNRLETHRLYDNNRMDTVEAETETAKIKDSFITGIMTTVTFKVAEYIFVLVGNAWLLCHPYASFLITCTIGLVALWGFGFPRNNPPEYSDDAGPEYSDDAGEKTLLSIGETISVVAYLWAMFALLVGAVGSIIDARFTLDALIDVAATNVVGFLFFQVLAHEYLAYKYGEK